jgi:hypothetical protein
MLNFKFHEQRVCTVHSDKRVCLQLFAFSGEDIACNMLSFHSSCPLLVCSVDRAVKCVEDFGRVIISLSLNARHMISYGV